MREEIIQKTMAFITTELDKLASFKDNNTRMAGYRFEHLVWVAHTGWDIADPTSIVTLQKHS